MKQIIFLIMPAVIFLFSACSEEHKESTAEIMGDSVHPMKEIRNDIKKSVLERESKHKSKAEKLAEEARKEVGKAAQAVKKKAEETTVSVKKIFAQGLVGEAGGNAGKEVYAKCMGCHGTKGRNKALGKSAVIAGQSPDTLIEKLNAYKAGKRNVAGMGTLMKGQVVSLSESDILAVSQYISDLK